VRTSYCSEAWILESRESHTADFSQLVEQTILRCAYPVISTPPPPSFHHLYRARAECINNECALLQLASYFYTLPYQQLHCSFKLYFAPVTWHVISEPCPWVWAELSVSQCRKRWYLVLTGIFFISKSIFSCFSRYWRCSGSGIMAQ